MVAQTVAHTPKYVLSRPSTDVEMCGRLHCRDFCKIFTVAPLQVTVSFCRAEA